jgi:hypothetical protein
VRLKQKLRRLVRQPAPRTLFEIVQEAGLHEEHQRRIAAGRTGGGAPRLVNKRPMATCRPGAGATAPAQPGSYWMARETVRLDATTLAALERIATGDDGTRCRGGRPRRAWRGRWRAARAWPSRCSPRRRASRNGGTLYDAIGIPRAVHGRRDDPRLRLRADDFELGAGDRGMLAANAGAFACFDVPAGGLALSRWDFGKA